MWGLTLGRMGKDSVAMITMSEESKNTSLIAWLLLLRIVGVFVIKGVK